MSDEVDKTEAIPPDAEVTEPVPGAEATALIPQTPELPDPPPRVAPAPGALRQDVLATAQRDLGKAATSPVLVHLEEVLADDERVDTLATCDPPGSVLAITDHRVLVVSPGTSDVDERRYADVRDVVALPAGKQAVVCPLRAGDIFTGWVTSRDAAKHVVGFARERLVPTLGEFGGEPWYDDPQLTLGARYDDAALVVAPDEATIPGRTAVVVSLVTTGVQMTTAGQTAGVEPVRAFLPWSSVSGVVLEPPEQSMTRPGFAEAVQLGVPGASKRAANKRASLALATADGDYVLVLRGVAFEDTATALGPLLSRFPGAAVTAPAPAPARGAAAAAPAPAADPVDQIRRLGELRDDGLITPEEFDAKKTEILGRM